MNHKKLYRLYKEERLTVRKRGGRKRALGTRAPMAIPQGPNQRWSLDFVSDSLIDGRRFRILSTRAGLTMPSYIIILHKNLAQACRRRQTETEKSDETGPVFCTRLTGTLLAWNLFE